MYKQKGTGLARHSTKSVFQFRGGAKYNAGKQKQISQINKRSLILSMKSEIVIKILESKFILINKILNIQNLNSIGLLIHASLKQTLLLQLIKCGFNCIHWSNVNIALISKSQLIIITKRAIFELSDSLKLKWQIIKT